LEASPQLDLFDASLAEQGLARPWEFGIHMEPLPEKILRLNARASKLAKPIVDAGGRVNTKSEKEALAEVNACSAKLNEWVYGRTAKRLSEGKIVGLVGGDHSVSLGAIRACAEAHPGMGILHIDAHADLRDAYEGFQWSHASIMNNVLREVPGVAKLVQVGIRDFCDSEYDITQNDPRVETHFDFALKRDLLSGKPWSALVQAMLAPLPQKIYVSFDIDGLEPWLCPGTGTPVPGGLSYEQAVFLLEALARAGKVVVGFDLNEVAPSGKAGDEWDGNVGARLLYKLCGVALLSQGARNKMKI
jgi:agmatinase